MSQQSLLIGWRSGGRVEFGCGLENVVGAEPPGVVSRWKMLTWVNGLGPTTAMCSCQNSATTS